MKKEYAKKGIEVGLSLLILLIPLQFYFNFYKHLSVSCAQLLAGLIFILWLFRLHRERDYIPKKAPLNLPITLFILMMIISIFISTDKPTSLKYTIKWTSSIMLYFIVVNNIENHREIKRLLGIIIASGIGLALIGIVEYALGGERMYNFVSTSRLAPLIIEPETLKVKLAGDGFNWFRLPTPTRAFGTFACAVGYSAYLGLILPLSSWLLFKRWAGQKWAGIGILLMIIAVILSFTRSAWLGMAASLFLMMLLSRRLLRPGRLSIIGIILFLCLVTLPLSTHIKNRTLQIFDSKEISSRLGLWETAANIIKARPILGVGVANYEDGAARFAKIGPADSLPAHSNYLQIGAEMGLLGLAAFLWIIIGGIVCSLRIFKRSTDKEIRLLGLGFLGFWTWFAIQSQFATYYESDKFSMLFWLMTGLNMVVYRFKEIGQK